MATEAPLFFHGQLNYDETVRRLKEFVEREIMPRYAIRLLIKVLEQNRKNLYFEEKNDAQTGS